MTRRHPRMCLLWIWMTTHNIKGFKTPKKGTWLSIFQPKWQNYKIVISPAGNIGSIPNFDRVIKPHRWLRGWSRITKFIFKMADGRHIAKCWKRYNLPINGPTWMKPGWSHHTMSPTCPPWCGCYGNGRCLATAHCTFSMTRTRPGLISRQVMELKHERIASLFLTINLYCLLSQLLINTSKRNLLPEVSIFDKI